mmetsp:Transcript_11915/g.22656  ORF Transcript_11915/g.22656 Transcript_11915/m.22656 type:complete len:244 (-) Transcript_11915:828-1559(-)
MMSTTRLGPPRRFKTSFGTAAPAADLAIIGMGILGKVHVVFHQRQHFQLLCRTSYDFRIVRSLPTIGARTATTGDDIRLFPSRYHFPRFIRHLTNLEFTTLLPRESEPFLFQRAATRDILTRQQTRSRFGRRLDQRRRRSLHLRGNVRSNHGSGGGEQLLLLLLLFPTTTANYGWMIRVRHDRGGDNFIIAIVISHQTILVIDEGGEEGHVYAFEVGGIVGYYPFLWLLLLRRLLFQCFCCRR